jgi:hypothetical protein
LRWLCAKFHPTQYGDKPLPFPTIHHRQRRCRYLPSTPPRDPF